MATNRANYRCGWVFSLILLVIACQKNPALAPAADPLSASSPPPMGATTYNDELKRELNVLDNLLNNRIDEKTKQRITTALMEGNKEMLPTDPKSDEAYLVRLIIDLPELIHKNRDLSESRRLFLKGKLFFLKRRFIEAAMHMSEVLKAEPKFIEARNLRARAIFFLGNPDLAVSELESIIKENGQTSLDGLDALYLIGAINYESNDRDKKRLNKGITAWTNYLTLAEADTTLKTEIESGLQELQARLNGEQTINKTVDPFFENPHYTPEKNAILAAFHKDQLLLAMKLSDQLLKDSYDKDIATIKARILFKTGQVDEAFQQFRAIITKDEKYAPGHHYLGMAYMLKGRPNDAVMCWQKTVDLDANYAESHGLKQRIAVAQKMIGPQTIDTH